MRRYERFVEIDAPVERVFDIFADFEAVFSETPGGTTLLRVVRGYDTPGGRTGRAVARFFGRHPEEQLEEDLARLRRLAERPRRRGGGRLPRVMRVERGERDDVRRARHEEPRARYALT